MFMMYVHLMHTGLWLSMLWSNFQKRRSKYYTVKNLPGFLDAQNANLFMICEGKISNQILKVIWCPFSI
jgi:hypothetical protein